MKALYVIWADFEYIDKAIDAGIDTLIIANQNLPTDTDPLPDDGSGGNWGMWDDCKKTIEKYQMSGVRILFNPILVPYWKDLPKDQQFYDGKEYHARTPCPTSVDFVVDRVFPAYQISKRYNIELVFDIENYGETRCLWNKGRWSRLKCKCDRCKGKSTSKQYKIHHDLMNGAMDGRAVGSFPYDSKWVLNLFGKKGKYFTEYTYSSDSSLKNKMWVIWLKLTGTKTYAGIWMEKFSAESLLKKIEKTDKAWKYEGYWLYPHARMSKYSPLLYPYHYEGINPYNNTLVDHEDPQFFQKLKKINN